MTILRLTLASLLAAVLIAAGTGQAQTPPSAEQLAMLRGYVMTVSTLDRFAKAAAELRQAEATDPSLQAEDAELANGTGVEAQLHSLQAHPRLAGYFRRQGLTDQDTLMFPSVVMAAMIVANAPGTANIEPVTPTQVQFYRDHKQALDAIFLADSAPGQR